MLYQWNKREEKRKQNKWVFKTRAYMGTRNRGKKSFRGKHGRIIWMWGMMPVVDKQFYDWVPVVIWLTLRGCPSSVTISGCPLCPPSCPRHPVPTPLPLCPAILLSGMHFGNVGRTGSYKKSLSDTLDIFLEFISLKNKLNKHDFKGLKKMIQTCVGILYTAWASALKYF